MFSRYKKSGGPPKAANDKPEDAAEAPAPKKEAKPAPSMRKSAAAEAAFSADDDKALKRRQRLEQVRSSLHHRLLDNLNLAALENALKAS